MPIEIREEGEEVRSVWFAEGSCSTRARTFKTREVLVNTKGALQHIQVIDTEDLGRVLVLDGVVQTSTIPVLSAPYCEMLAHIPLFSHENPRKGLVVGGGDFEVAREVLKHSCVQHLDVVDIDIAVSNAVLEHMPEIAEGITEDDPRLHMHYADGAEFIKKVQPETYDFILIDSPDSGGSFASLFSIQFVQMLYRALKSGGVMTRQIGSLQFRPDDAPAHFRCIESVFDDAAVYLSSAPLCGEGDFGFVLGRKKPPSAFKPRLASLRRLAKLRGVGSLYYYTPEVHIASFVLPKYVQGILDTVYGWELLLEVHGCVLNEADAEGKCEDFVVKLCENIGMKRYGPFRFEDFGHQKLATSGPSLCQWIETSSIQGHISSYWNGLLFLTIFTCAPCDFQKAICFTRNFFGAKEAFGTLHERGSRRNMKKKKVHFLGDFSCSNDGCAHCRAA